MAPSQVSGKKMRNLLFGVILGLLAVVHSTPVNTVAQDEVYREAVTDGYLVDEFLLPSLTTESPKRNATVPASHQPTSSESKESDVIEGSGGQDHEFLLPGGEHYATTTQSSTTAVLPEDNDDSSSDSTTTQAPHSGSTSPSVPDEALSTDNDAIVEDTIYMSTTFTFLQDGDEHFATTTPSVPQSSTTAVLPEDNDDSSSDSTTTRAPHSGSTSPSVPDEALSTDNDVIVEDTIYMSTTFTFLQDGDEHFATTTPGVPQSSTTTVLPEDNDDSSSDSTTTQALFKESDMTEGSGDQDHESTTPVFLLHGDEHHATTTQSVSQSSTTTVLPGDNDNYNLATSSDDFSGNAEGSGVEDQLHIFSVTRSSMTSTSNTETSTASSTSMATIVIEKIEKGVHGQARANKESPSPQNTEHSTPSWIIIVGFIVGVAALVMLRVAIATRDKWNGPRQASQAKTNSSNQQRELEMETFLHKDNPRENGKAAEYTVIPLDELPDKYSSH